MAASLNRVDLIGNVGNDPELRYTNGGTPVCNFSLATSRSWKDKDEKWQQETQWHRVVAWGPTGERASNVLKKGSSCYITGRLEYGKYVDKSGVEKQQTNVVADRVMSLDKREKDDLNSLLDEIN